MEPRDLSSNHNQAGSVSGQNPPIAPTTKGATSRNAGRNSSGQQITPTTTEPRTPSHTGQRPDSVSLPELKVEHTEPQQQNMISSWLQYINPWASSKKIESVISTQDTVNQQRDSGSVAESHDLTKRDVTGVQPIPKARTSSWWPSWFSGNKVEVTEAKPALLPRAEQTAPDKRSKLTKVRNFLGGWTAWGISGINYLTGGVAGRASSNLAVSQFHSTARSILENKLSTRFPHLTDAEFKAVLDKVMTLLLEGGSQHLELNEIHVDIGQPHPIIISDLRLDVSSTTLLSDCSSIQTQSFRRSLKIKNFSCRIRLPRGEAAPSELRLVIPKAVLTVGSNLPAIARDANLSDYWKLYSEGSADLPADNTAIDLKAEKAVIRYDKIASVTPLSASTPTQAGSTGLLGFNKGSVEFKHLRFSRPIKVLTAPSNQSSTVQFEDFKLNNEPNPNLLMDLHSVDATGLDHDLNGNIKADLTLDLNKVREMEGYGGHPKWMYNFKLSVAMDSQVKKGEIDFSDLRKGLTVKSAGGKGSKLVAYFLNLALSSDQTCLKSGKNGKPRLHIHIPLLYSLSFLPGIDRLLSFDIPLPDSLKGVSIKPDSGGKIVTTELLSNLFTSLLNAWSLAPAKVHLVKPGLETLACDAASGSQIAAETLLSEAEGLKINGHNDLALRLMETIPFKTFVALSENGTLSSEQLNTIACQLLDSDQDKAIALYGHSLRGKNLSNPSREFNVSAMMKAAENLNMLKADERAVAIDIYEFLAQAAPEEDSISRLCNLCIQDQYPPAKMADLLKKSLLLPPYSENPELQISLMNRMESVLKEENKGVLLELTQYALSKAAQENMKFLNALTSLELVMVKNGLSNDAATIRYALGETEQATLLLEQGIKNSDPASLQGRIKRLIQDQPYHPESYQTAYSTLSDILSDEDQSDEMRIAAHSLFINLWQNSIPHSSEWIETLPANHFQETAKKLFTITTVERESPELFLLKLRAISSELSDALLQTDISSSQEFTLTSLTSIVNTLIDDGKFEQSFKFILKEANTLAGDPDSTPSNDVPTPVARELSNAKKTFERRFSSRSLKKRSG